MTISPLYPNPVSKKEFQRLEASIEQSFQTADSWFEAIDANFQSINDRFRVVDFNFKTTHKRFDELDVRFDKLEARVSEGFEMMEKYINNSFIMFGKELDKNMDFKFGQFEAKILDAINKK